MLIGTAIFREFARIPAQTRRPGHSLLASVAVNEHVVADALAHLAAPGDRYAVALTSVPDVAGLYAVHADPMVWQRLGLGGPPDDRPLYVGKAERSLASRDVNTHFGTGKTGSSTVRRTLAGLLATDLRLTACPRNVEKPSHFANYGLELEGDARLTAWMVDNLRLATWASGNEDTLDLIETAVLRHLVPPLNVAKVTTPWRAQVKLARRQMATQASAWRVAPPS